jgi:hypothetical protein
MSFLEKSLVTQLVKRIYPLPNMKVHCYVHTRLPLGCHKPEQLNSQFHTTFIEGSPYSSSFHLPTGKKNFRDIETDRRMITKCNLSNVIYVSWWVPGAGQCKHGTETQGD